MPGEDPHATVSIALVRVLLKALAPDRASELLTELGVSPVQLADDMARLPRDVSTRAWRRAPELSGDTRFGLHLAEHLPFGTFGVLEMIARSSRTLGEGLEKMVSYYRVLDGRDALSVEKTPAGASLIFDVPTPNHHVAECLMATMSRALRDLWTGFAPREVWFAHAGPADAREHERVIGVPVRFGQPSTRLVFATEDLERVMPSPGRQALAAIDAHPAPSFLDQVREAIEAQIATDCSATAVARRLGLGERTLRRRLTEAGSAFSSLLDDTRCALAKRHLGESELSIYEVALRLGFSDQRAFARAFKRWTGMTPMELRQKE